MMSVPIEPSTTSLTSLVEKMLGGPALQVVPLSGDASSRLFFRVFSKSNRTFILCDSTSIPGCWDRMILSQRVLAAAGLPVPKVAAKLKDAQLVLFEDFGDQYLADATEASPQKTAAILASHLARIDKLALPKHLLPPMDAPFLWQEWTNLLEDPRAAELSLVLKSQKPFLMNLWADNEMRPAHRDLTSRNIMVKPDGSLGIIDFQDLRLGPMGYDVASYLSDPYRGWDLSRYLEERRLFAEQVRLPVPSIFAGVEIQRTLKALSTFLSQDRLKGKPFYLRYVPDLVRSWAERDFERMLPGSTRGLSLICQRLP